MCHCLRSSYLPLLVSRTWNSAFIYSNSKPTCLPINIAFQNGSFSLSNAGGNRQLGALGSQEFLFSGELGFKDEGNAATASFQDLEEASSRQAGTGASSSADYSSELNFLELEKEEEEEEGKGKSSSKEEDLIPTKSDMENAGLRRGKQMIKRSNIVAKQVISVQSALSLGFVSQLWVDTTSWLVLVVEVRPNLLSGESGSFLLEDVSQIGDVVLVEDENVMENDFKILGLETLVGYRVVTPGGQNIGKVRGYSFNINSGVVESLEFDSFGLSIIPSSLVSTYGLPVEDVLEVVSDAVVVHEAAAYRLQRLTKGFWDSYSRRTLKGELDEYSGFRGPNRSDQSQRRRRQRRFSRQKSQTKMRDSEDDWELPLDYL